MVQKTRQVGGEESQQKPPVSTATAPTPLDAKTVPVYQRRGPRQYFRTAEAPERLKAEKQAKQAQRAKRLRKKRDAKHWTHTRKPRLKAERADLPEVVTLVSTEAIVRDASTRVVARDAKTALAKMNRRFRSLPSKALIRHILRARHALVQSAPDVVRILIDSMQQAHESRDFKTAGQQALAVLEAISHKDDQGHAHRVIEDDDGGKHTQPMQIAIGVQLGGTKPALPAAPIAVTNALDATVRDESDDADE